MKFYVKFFNEYEEMMENHLLEDQCFSELQGCVKLEILEEEFEYAKLNIIFDAEIFDKMYRGFNKKYIKLCYKKNDNTKKLKEIFNGCLLKSYSKNQQNIFINYVAKPLYISDFAINDDGEKNRISEISLKKKYLFCDKATHKIEKANLSSPKNCEKIQTILEENTINVSKTLIKNELFSEYFLNIKCNFLFLSVFKQNIYKEIAKKFSGMTLSYNGLLKNMGSELQKLQKDNIFISKCVIKEIAKKYFYKEIGDYRVELKKSKIYGHVWVNIWQNLIKNVNIEIKTDRFFDKSNMELCEKKVINVNLGNFSSLFLNKWSPNLFYNVNDFVILGNAVMYCTEEHFSKNILNSIEEKKWKKIKKDDFFNNFLAQKEIFLRKINNVIDVFNSKILINSREQKIELNLMFKDIFFDFSVNGFVNFIFKSMSNVVNLGKITKISHVFSNNVVFTSITIFLINKKILNYKNIFKLSEDISQKIQNIFSNEGVKINIIDTIVVEKDYEEQTKNIEKSCKNIENFKNNFEKNITKYKIKLKHFPKNIYENITIN